MRKKGGLKSIIMLVGAVIVGTFFSQQIKDVLVKIPVIGDWIQKKEEIPNE